MSDSAVYKTLNGQNAVTFDFCKEVAVALGESPVHVFRIANLLPRVPDAKGSDAVQSILDLLEMMDEETRRDVLHYTKMRYQNPVLIVE